MDREQKNNVLATAVIVAIAALASPVVGFVACVVQVVLAFLVLDDDEAIGRAYAAMAMCALAGVVYYPAAWALVVPVFAGSTVMLHWVFRRRALI